MIFHHAPAPELTIPVTISECPIGPPSGVRVGAVEMAVAGKVAAGKAADCLQNPMSHVPMVRVRESGQ